MDLTKYPRAKAFLESHPDMTLDQAIIFVDYRIKELGVSERWGQVVDS